MIKVKVKVDMTGWVMAEHGVPDSRLTVIGRTDDYVAPDGSLKARWLCKCSCGSNKDVIAYGSDLTRNQKRRGVKSCGCLYNEAIKQFNKTKKKYNQYNLDGKYGIGLTSNTNREFYFDLEDYDKIKNYCWGEVVDDTNYHYLATILIDENGKHKTLRMHSLIVDYKLCDHIDRNPFNNQKGNLREASFSENAQNRSLRSDNTSGVVGVSWLKKDECWISYLTLKGKRVYNKCFIDKEDAIKARLQAELQYFGEFAPQKHLFEKYRITAKNDCEEI